MPKISFTQTEKVATLSGDLSPKPSVQSVPAWFNATPKAAPGIPAKDFPLGTVRQCMPFFDAMTAGYMLTLPEALHIYWEPSTKVIHFSWRHDGMGLRVEVHPPQQMPDSVRPAGGIFKFMHLWGVSIPDTHSLLYTHPLNRHDLPFRSFSGVVDGTYGSPVNIPFAWLGKEGDSFELDAGTPIAQIIPFLREDWDREDKVVSDHEIDVDSYAALTHLEGYRKLFRRVKNWR